MSIANNNVEIFPNPSNGTFTVKGLGFNINKLEVYDINGRMVVSRSIEIINKSETINLDNILKSGIYFLRLSSSNTSIIKKVVIQ